MRLAVFEATTDDQAVFAGLSARLPTVFCAEALTLATVAGFRDAEIVSTFIYSDLSRAVLSRLEDLKMIATRSTGFDHIDLAACAERGIAVCNVPTYGENTVAEHVFALLLAISHRLPEAVARARSGPFSPLGLEGFDLQGKTLGVVGVGSIGRCVIRIARGFGMKVLGADLQPDPDCAAALGFSYVELDDLLGVADVVTLHVPALPGEQPLLDAAGLARMKPGAILINTARGSLVDTGALLAALRSGHVAHAGLDVLAEEPMIREEAELVLAGRGDEGELRRLIADHVLLQSPQVIVTPHSAFNTREAVGRIAQTTIANIDALLDGRPINLVDGVG